MNSIEESDFPKILENIRASIVTSQYLKEKFDTRYASNPSRALEWADDHFKHVAKLEIYSAALSHLESGGFENVKDLYENLKTCLVSFSQYDVGQAAGICSPYYKRCANAARANLLALLGGEPNAF